MPCFFIHFINLHLHGRKLIHQPAQSLIICPKTEPKVEQLVIIYNNPLFSNFLPCLEQFFTVNLVIWAGNLEWHENCGRDFINLSYFSLTSLKYRALRQNWGSNFINIFFIVKGFILYLPFIRCLINCIELNCQSKVKKRNSASKA